MLNVTQLIGFGVATGHPTVEYIDTYTLYDGANRTTYLLANAALGTPKADRIIVVGFSGDGASAPTTVTAKLGGSGGVAMNLIAATASSQAGGALFYLLYPSGATADIYFEFAPYAGSVAVSIHAIYGANQQDPYTYTTDTADIIMLSDEVEAGSVGIAHTGGTVLSATASCAWTGLTLNETLSIYAHGVVSSAHGEFTENESPRTLTADWANLGTNAIGIFAAWR